MTFVHSDRYWWHESIARELRRLRDQCGTPAYNIRGIAGNISQSECDVAKAVMQMLGWGELRKAEPLWDFAPDSWVALA